MPFDPSTAINDLPDLLNRLRESLTVIEAGWNNSSNLASGQVSEIQAARTVIDQVNQTLEEYTKGSLENHQKEMAWWVSFPERNPNPVLEIGLEGRIHYANPAARQLFPDLEERGTAHPFLAGWEAVMKAFNKEPGIVLLREEQVEDHIFQQALSYIEEYQCVRLYSRDITTRKKDEIALLESHETLQQQAEELEVQTEELIVQNEELISAQEKLQKNEETLRNYLEGMHDMFLSLDRDWRIVYANHVFAEALGFQSQDLIGRDFWQTFPLNLGTNVEKTYRRVMTERTPLHIEPKGVYTSNWYSISIYPTDAGVSAFITDRTDELAAAEALRESENKFNTIFRDAPMAIALSRLPDGVLVEVNEAFEKLFDFKKGEIIGKTSAELGIAPNPENRQTLLNQILQHGFAHHVELGYRTRAGKPITLLGNIDQITIGQEKFILNTFENITERKQIEQQLRGMNETLEKRVLERTREQQNTNEQLLKALDNEKTLRNHLIQTEKYAALARLVGSVAHEINNPLQTVTNCLYLIRLGATMPVETQDIFSMAEGELKRIRVLVQQLRETYRPPNLKALDFDLVELLAKISILLAPQLRQNNVEWQVHADQARITLHGIPDQIQQVCLNICLNAIDAMAPLGGGRLDISVSSLPDQVRISFKDSGPGIPEDIATQVFEPFFTTKARGTGLGLSICYEIVKNHGGEISVESQSCEGATFTVVLPVHS